MLVFDLAAKVIEALRPGPTLVAVDVQFIVQNAAYAAGNILAIATEIPGALKNGNPGVLVGLTLRDADNLTPAATDIYLFDRKVTIGTINSPISISDGDAMAKLAKIPITAANWENLVNSKQVSKWWSDIGPIPVRCLPNSESIWAALVTVDGTTPTSTTGFTGTFWFQQGKKA